MKQLFKSVILVVFVLLAMSAQAQVKIGVKGGLNVSTVSGIGKLLLASSESVRACKISSRAGFHAGVMAQFPLPSNFFIQPELLFSMQGLKSTVYIGASEVTGTDELNYLQLPVYAGYKINVGTGLDVIAGVGPYFAYGISGTDDAFDSDEGLKRLDIGASALAGIQFYHLQITIGYDLGLTDMVDINGWNTAKDLLGLPNICNRNLKFSVGYFF
jgi:hypothetical protein